MSATTASTIIDAEEFDALLSVAGAYARDVARPLALDVDAGDEEAGRRAWSALCEIGLERSLLAAEAGGPGLPDGTLAPLAEAVATGDGGTALRLVLSNVALAGLATPPAEAARWAYVPAAGVRGLEDAPELRANALVGEARFALGAAGADGLVIACRDTKGPALAAVVRGTPGLRERPVDDQLGLRGAPAAVLSFDHATAIPLGGVDAAARAGALVHAGVAGIARGIARRAHEMAFAYAEERYQGGGPIIIHGAVRDMLARMAERELGVGRAPEPATAVDPAVALAQKAACTDAAVATTTDAVQVFGGMGYMRETGVEKLMRDARYCQLFPASNWATREALLQLQRTRRASSGHGT